MTPSRKKGAVAGKLRPNVKLLLVLTTTGSEQEARSLAETLVERRIAACVSILPGVQSVFRWKGAVERAQEWQLLIKTSATRKQQVLDSLNELHSYDVPESLVLDVVGGNAEYLTWLRESLEAE